MLALAGGDDESRHSVHSDLSSDEYESAAQSEHASDPGLALYVPGTQPMQLLIVPDQPAWHEQSAMLSLPTGEYVFSGHDTHKVLLPTAYDLAAQFSHVAEFRYAENFPAAQREHA